MIKSKRGTKVYLTYASSSNEARTGAQTEQNLKTGTDIEAMEECYFLVCTVLLVQPVFL